MASRQVEESIEVLEREKVVRVFRERPFIIILINLLESVMLKVLGINACFIALNIR